MVARGGLTIALLVALTAPASAQIELRNDGFEAGGGVGVQGGFAAGEIAAVRLTPPGSGPFTVTHVRFYFGGATTTHTVTLRIYADSAGATPGTELYSGDYEVTGADDALQEINLVGESVTVGGPFRVGIELTHDGVPSVARDDDGTIAATENFIRANGLGWVQSNTLGLTGDWVIRAFVLDTGGTPDAGVPAVDAAPPGTPDAASEPDAGAVECVSNGECPVGQYCNELNACSFDCREDTDCGDEMACNSLGMCVAAEGDGGGCGCRTSGRTGSGAAPLLLLLLLLLGIRRRLTADG